MTCITPLEYDVKLVNVNYATITVHGTCRLLWSNGPGNSITYDWYCLGHYSLFTEALYIILESLRY